MVLICSLPCLNSKDSVLLLPFLSFIHNKHHCTSPINCTTWHHHPYRLQQNQPRSNIPYVRVRAWVGEISRHTTHTCFASASDDALRITVDFRWVWWRIPWSLANTSIIIARHAIVCVRATNARCDRECTPCACYGVYVCVLVSVRIQLHPQSHPLKRESYLHNFCAAQIWWLTNWDWISNEHSTRVPVGNYNLRAFILCWWTPRRTHQYHINAGFRTALGCALSSLNVCVCVFSCNKYWDVMCSISAR